MMNFKNCHASNRPSLNHIFSKEWATACACNGGGRSPSFERGSLDDKTRPEIEVLTGIEFSSSIVILSSETILTAEATKAACEQMLLTSDCCPCTDTACGPCHGAPRLTVTKPREACTTMLGLRKTSMNGSAVFHQYPQIVTCEKGTGTGQGRPATSALGQTTAWLLQGTCAPSDDQSTHHNTRIVTDRSCRLIDCKPGVRL